MLKHKAFYLTVIFLVALASALAVWNNFATVAVASPTQVRPRTRPNRQAQPQADQAEQHKAHVNRVFVDLFTQGRYGAINQIYQPVCPVHTNGKDYTLQEAVAEGKGWRNAAPDLVMTADEMSVQGDIVSVSWTARGTHTGHGNGLRSTGRRILVHGNSRFRMVNGKIGEVWNNYDQKDMFRQLGVSPRAAWLYDKLEDMKLAWNHTFTAERAYASTAE